MIRNVFLGLLVIMMTSCGAGACPDITSTSLTIPVPTESSIDNIEKEPTTPEMGLLPPQNSPLDCFFIIFGVIIAYDNEYNIRCSKDVIIPRDTGIHTISDSSFYGINSVYIGKNIINIDDASFNNYENMLKKVTWDCERFSGRESKIFYGNYKQIEFNCLKVE